MEDDAWLVADQRLKSRLILGTARYPSPATLTSAIAASGAELVTVSLRRQDPSKRGGGSFWDLIQASGVRVLPNTAHCRSAREAIVTAQLARELFKTNWVKLEVIGDEATLAPDPFQLVEAARVLNAEGFEVFPYTTDDLVVAERLVEAGCRILMPWAAPIGTGQGIQNPERLTQLRQRFPKLHLIVDAGLGKPSHACAAMELGFDGVLLNTGIATADDPVEMARAFGSAVHAGRSGYLAGLMQSRSVAQPSTPLEGLPLFREMK